MRVIDFKNKSTKGVKQKGSGLEKLKQKGSGLEKLNFINSKKVYHLRLDITAFTLLTNIP